MKKYFTPNESGVIQASYFLLGRLPRLRIEAVKSHAVAVENMVIIQHSGMVHIAGSAAAAFTVNRLVILQNRKARSPRVVFIAKRYEDEMQYEPCIVSFDMGQWASIIVDRANVLAAESTLESERVA